MTIQEIVSRLTLEEKASLCSGKDFWHLKSVERLGLSSIMVTDGPHGLRKQVYDPDHLGSFDSVASTCFPVAATTACSFDRDLLYQIGQAIGEEALQENVSVVLGPGLNIKRSPLCGRNFEYVSEDPYVAGEMGTAIVKGIQSKGIGTSLKHYAANNQEKARFTCNSVLDERAFREIYLAGFEAVVRQSQPWTVMCSYNLINGVYACENHKLLTEILRDDWGFKGLVMTDWGAMNDRVEGIKAGLDLEMPASGGYNDAKIVEAVKNGRLDESALDKVVHRLVELILKSQENIKKDYQFDKAAHHALARKALAESAVLLKNDAGILPIKQGLRTEGTSIAVIGEFARTPRYQGAGSSKVNPLQLDNSLDAFKAAGLNFDFAPGYSGTAPDAALIEEAVRVAKGKDTVIIFAGLPAEYESEGFDREALDMPPSHNQLIEAVAKVNPNVVVVLQLGSPVILPWADTVKGIMTMYLGGQAGGGAVVDLLLGKNNPGGKLTESWPLSLQDTPCYHYYPGTIRSAEYRESIFVGYRYYDHGERAVAYPFGYGLSYTTFEYSDLKLNASSFKQGDMLQVSFTIKNTGAVAGSEVAQVYVAPKNSAIFRAVKELKGFEKIFLQSGESRTVTVSLDTRSFAYYNAPKKTWALEEGIYEILVGPSSRDLPLKNEVQVQGDGYEALLQDQKRNLPEYFILNAKELVISDASFAALYGQAIPPSQREAGHPIDLNTTIEELKGNAAGEKLLAFIRKQMAARFAGDNDSGFRTMFERMLMEMPLRSLPMVGGGHLPPPALEVLVDVLNGRPCTDPALAQIFG